LEYRIREMIGEIVLADRNWGEFGAGPGGHFPGLGLLVISDVVMPRIDGPTLIKELRVRRPDLRVIFISGYAEDAFRKRVDAGEEAHFLMKPFTLKQLAAKVKEVLP